MQKIAKFCVVTALTLAAAACRPEAAPDPGPAQAAAAGSCGEAGYLRGRLYGVIAATLDWSAADLVCEGMPRPEGRGVRLRFAGATGARSLAIIIALPELQRGADSTGGAEFASNVTLIEEGNGRFFSTSDLNACVTAIDTLKALDASGDRLEVSGTLACLAPLVEINGTTSVSIPELRFSGLLDWTAS